MAQKFVTDAGTLITPGAYPQVKVQNGASGLSTTGVVMLIGEADAGPDYTLEDELGDNAFGPDQFADVAAKYKSGNLVNAFKAASVPANDPDIQGSPNRFILVKTNASAKASEALDAIGGGDYGVLYDKSYGQLGNLIYFTVSAKVAEVQPTTGSVTYIPNVDTINATVRVDGGASQALSLAANTTPAAFQAAVAALTDVACSGGADRLLIQAARVSDASTLAVSASGNVITLTISSAWSVTPTVGDTLTIPTGSAVAGGSGQNIGAYVITARTTSTITATKLSDAGKGGAVAGTITAPVTVGAADIAATTDAKAWSPITITLEFTDPVDGVGKTLEINDLATGNDLLRRTLFALGTTTAVTWISTTGSPQLITSAAEYVAQLNANRQMDNVQESLSAGGAIALKMGYQGTTCSVVVTATTLTATRAGGSGADLSINLAQFPTLADLAAYISAQPGYVAAVGSTALGRQAATTLDRGTFTAATTFGNYTLRLKADADDFFDAVSSGSVLVQLGDPAARVDSGLPDVMASPTYLSGGSKGGTTDAIVTAALAALESVRGNFVVPLFARDASSDLSDGLTESSSTYTIAAIQAAAKNHVLAMSTLKRRRNRQAFLANRGTFEAAKEAAGTIASYRCSLAFQDVKVSAATGLIQAQPWMLAALAAGTQAAGFYRAIVHKGINCSGVLQAAKDFKDSNDSNVEDALLAGLLFAKKSDTGGFFWVSDQTTYATDENFVYNSIQAVYVADTIALTCSQRMENAFVGQSIADVSAALALTALEGIMQDFLRLKLIAPSDDAPKGFKNAVIRISGPSMVVNVEIKLAGAIYFIPINFLVSQVTQTAAA